MKVTKLLLGLSFTSALAAAGGSAYLYQQTQTLKFNNQELESNLLQLREQNAALKHQADQADSFKQEIERLHDQIKDLLSQRNTLKNEVDAESAKATGLQQEIEKIDSEKRELEAKLNLTQAAQAAAVDETAPPPEPALPTADSVPSLDLPRSFVPSSTPEPQPEPVKPVSVLAESLPGIPVEEEPEPPAPKKQMPPKAEVKAEPEEEPKKAETKKVEPEVIPTPAASEKVEAKKEEAKTAPVIRPAEDTRPQQVLSVNRQFNFVVVNVGLRDKIKIGDVLRVEDKGKLIGKIQVEKLYDNFSACAIMEEIKPAQIHEGDPIHIG